jgi:hypothetical protein
MDTHLLLFLDSKGAVDFLDTHLPLDSATDLYVAYKQTGL